MHASLMQSVGHVAVINSRLSKQFSGIEVVAVFLMLGLWRVF